jgi:hypothetical protein
MHRAFDESEWPGFKLDQTGANFTYVGTNVLKFKLDQTG